MDTSRESRLQMYKKMIPAPIFYLKISYYLAEKIRGLVENWGVELAFYNNVT